MTQAIGWFSSLLLLVTIVRQVAKEWTAKNPAESSWSLFLGQLAASAGFVTYSILKDDPVFILTNSLLFASAGVGLYATFRARARQTATPLPERSPG